MRGSVQYGMARRGRRGGFRQGLARCGEVRQGRQGRVRTGTDWFGQFGSVGVWQAWQISVGSGTVWSGKEGQAWWVAVCPDRVRWVVVRQAGCVRDGNVWKGLAGKVRQVPVRTGLAYKISGGLR